MSFQQRTIGEICSELLAEAVRMGVLKAICMGAHVKVFEHHSRLLPQSSHLYL